MNSYDRDKYAEEWNEKLHDVELEGDRLAKGFYSTPDYYYVGWEISRHGMLILDFQGTIIAANPYFCEKLDYNAPELIGKKVETLCVKDDDLYRSDTINILTLLKGGNQQIADQCELSTKDHTLHRCKWVANRIPTDLNKIFSFSVVHVYFLGEAHYNKLIEEIDKARAKEAKENNIWFKIFDSIWSKVILVLIVILTALGGSLPDLVRALIEKLN